MFGFQQLMQHAMKTLLSASEGTFLGDKRPLNTPFKLFSIFYLNELQEPLDYLKFSLLSIP